LIDLSDVPHNTLDAGADKVVVGQNAAHWIDLTGPHKAEKMEILDPSGNVP
jgi:hypothetical protein